MVYIQVYIPEKNNIYDFKISASINVCMLKKLIIESIYDISYDEEFIRKNYLFISLNDYKKLDNCLTISDYSVYDGEKFILV